MRLMLFLGLAVLVSGCTAQSDGPICQTAGYQMGASMSYQCLDDQQDSQPDLAEVLPVRDPYRINGAQ